MKIFSSRDDAEDYIRKENEKWEEWKRTEQIDLERNKLEKIFNRKNNLENIEDRF